MLTEPELDTERLALDRALADALAARVAAGPWSSTDAEAIALRTLLSDSLNAASAEVLRAVWARLSVAHGQAVTAWGAAAALLAADRYGAGVRPEPEAADALTAARNGARAVLDLGREAWWGKLLAMPHLRVIGALPDTGGQPPSALIVSREPTGPTGEDRTFWVTDSPLSEARIVEALGAAGLAAGLLATSGGLKLFMLAGYVQPEDGRLRDAPGDLTGVIGAAPVF